MRIRRSSSSASSRPQTITSGGPAQTIGPALSFPEEVRGLSFAKILSACDFNRIGIVLHRRVAISTTHDKCASNPRGSDVNSLTRRGTKTRAGQIQGEEALEYCRNGPAQLGFRRCEQKPPSAIAAWRLHAEAPRERGPGKRPARVPWGKTLPILHSADWRLCNLGCVISDR